MQKRLFNQYKLKKQLKRVFSKDIRPIVSPDGVSAKSTKDFAWHMAKQNPFYRPHEDKKRIFYAGVGVASFLGIIFLGIYHPFFSISKVDVLGLERINKEEFTSAVLGILNYKKFFILPAKSYFLADVQEVKDILQERYPLSKIVVQKTFPNHIQVTVQEKVSTIIYDNGDEYSYLGLDGQLVEKIRKVGQDEWKYETEMTTTTDSFGNTSTVEKTLSGTHTPPVQQIIKEMGDNPIVYDTRAKKGGVNDHMLEKKDVESIIAWFELLRNNLQIAFGWMRIENSQGDAVIRTREGWDIKMNLERAPEAQFQGLETMIKTLEKSGEHQQYIDVRFPGQIFWQ